MTQKLCGVVIYRIGGAGGGGGRRPAVGQLVASWLCQLRPGMLVLARFRVRQTLPAQRLTASGSWDRTAILTTGFSAWPISNRFAARFCTESATRSRFSSWPSSNSAGGNASKAETLLSMSPASLFLINSASSTISTPATASRFAGLFAVTLHFDGQPSAFAIYCSERSEIPVFLAIAGQLLPAVRSSFAIAFCVVLIRFAIIPANYLPAFAQKRQRFID